MERGVRVNGEDYYYSSGDGSIGVASYSSASTLPRCGVAAACDGSVGGGGLNYIEHHVSKFDTLAGVAIRYGVEVADVKRINGLVTDLQMFARKTLKIPLPGRHPPSPSLSNGFDTQGASISEQTPPNRRQSDLFDSFQSLKLKPSTQRKVSPAMSSLQGHYGLGPSDQKALLEGSEMATYQKGISFYLEDDGPSPVSSPKLNPPLNPHRKCKSVSNGFLIENGHLADYESNQETKDNGSDRLCEKSFRRRQKSEADFCRTQEMIVKEDNSNGGGFSSIASKGLALRPNSASRTATAAESEASLINPIPIGLGDSLIADSLDRVRKSSSASNLQDPDTSTLASLWPTSKWSLTDFQALSTAALTRSIFDGLPKPISGRRNKAALD